MATPLEQALDRFVNRFVEQQQSETGDLPLIELDTDWPSACYRGQADPDGRVRWQPTRQDSVNAIFDGLSLALETEIHPDIRCYFGRYWSDPLPAHSEEGDLSLLFVWNDEDYERLRANLIGHALAKRKQKQPLTLFFGCTEPEDYVLSLDNNSGAVLLERPGHKPLRELAPSLQAFIERLEPKSID